MILNNNKEVLVGKRLDHPSGFWQMPQGGIDEKENPKEAVWREMMEEIGTNKAKLIKESDQWINYDIPSETLKTLPWGHKYKGQTQKWFAFQFTGEENDINVVLLNKQDSSYLMFGSIELYVNEEQLKKATDLLKYTEDAENN